MTGRPSGVSPEKNRISGSFYPPVFVGDPHAVARRGLKSLALFLVAAALASTATADALLPRELAFYVVRPSPSEPGLDGKLPAHCWDSAAVATTYYEYWKSNPGPGKLKTELRMLYSARGVNIKITNYEKDIGKVQSKITRADDPDLWKDDSAQIYFDPAANGVGYANFTVNALGAKADMKRFDAAVVLPEWSGDEWRAATKADKDSWTIEAFFPWSDLGREASSGDIWKFNHVRFSWNGDKLTGVTWAAGGNYANPRFFGYIYFADSQPVPYDKVIHSLSEKAGPPWVVFTDKGVFSCLDTGKTDFFTFDEFVGKYLADMGAALRKLEDLLKEDRVSRTQLEELKKTAAQLASLKSADALKEIKRIVEITHQLDEMYWLERIERMFRQLERTATGHSETSHEPK